MNTSPEEASERRWRRWLRDLGPLRMALLFCALVLLVVVPTPGTRAVFTGWPLVGTVLAPVLAPLVMMVLLLDALMARVFLTDAEGAEWRRLRAVICINLAAVIALFARWLPYYAALRV